jgi:hypothetical protein
VSRLASPRLWLQGLVSAVLVGAGTAGAEALATGTVHWRVVGAAALIGAVRAGFLHMKEKPLPRGYVRLRRGR